MSVCVTSVGRIIGRQAILDRRSHSIEGRVGDVRPPNEVGYTSYSAENLSCDFRETERPPSRSGVNHDLTLAGNERWFLVHTLPKKELQARMRLGVQGFRTYLPLYLRTIRHARQLRTIRAPLFPRYLFVILDLGRDRWLSVRSTVGVSSLIGCDDLPVPVPVGIVETLIAQTDAANLTLFGDALQAGQRVRIASGAFADSIGTLDRVDDAGRVRLLLNMMGSVIAITLPRSGILPAA